MTDEAQNPEPEGEEEARIQVAVIAQGGAEDMSKLGDVLTAADVPHDIISPEDCDTGGCGPRLMLVTPMDAMEAAREAIENHWDSELPETERYAPVEVMDFDAGEATCPACQTPFPTADATRCPECGLNFGE